MVMFFFVCAWVQGRESYIFDKRVWNGSVNNALWKCNESKWCNFISVCYSLSSMATTYQLILKYSNINGSCMNNAQDERRRNIKRACVRVSSTNEKSVDYIRIFYKEKVKGNFIARFLYHSLIQHNISSLIKCNFITSIWLYKIIVKVADFDSSIKCHVNDSSEKLSHPFQVFYRWC